MALELIAKNEGIMYRFIDFPDDAWLAGMLLYRDQKRKIIINTHINNTGRINFTFAHELGHHFLTHPPSLYTDGQSGFRCTHDDIKEGCKLPEIEANQFAVELLLPEDRFRLDMAGSPIDFELIRNLANTYMVSKHACSNRLLSLIQAPCIIIRSKGIQIVGFATSQAARGYLRKLNTIPTDTTAYKTISEYRWHENFKACDSSTWLSRAIPGETVYEHTRIHRESDSSMTIIKW